MRKLVAIGLALAALATVGLLLLPSLAAARKSSPQRDCRNNLRQLGTYLVMYESKYQAYPPTGPAFMPTLRGFVGPGQDGLFVCKSYGSVPGPGVTDYRGPAAGVVLDANTPASTPVIADCLNNHAGSSGGIQVLSFDGSVSDVMPGTPAWGAVLAGTVPPAGRSETLPPLRPAPTRIAGVTISPGAYPYALGGVLLLGLLVVVAAVVMVRSWTRRD